MVGRGIDARAARKAVAARAADQGVIPETAIDHVVFRIASKKVVMTRAGQIPDAYQHIAFGVAAGCRRSASSETHGHGRIGIGPRRGIHAAAAIQSVRSGPAGQSVVAGPAIQSVCSVPAGQSVVACPPFEGVRFAVAREAVAAAGSDNHLYAGKRVVLRIAAASRLALNQAHSHGLGGV